MRTFDLDQAVELLAAGAEHPGRNLQMPGDPHYQPRDLRPYLGYDQRVGWQIIVEWAWLHVLANHGVIPEERVELLTPDLLAKLFEEITTTKVTELERKPEIGHDIIALLMLMRNHLPNELHSGLHLGLTSYDTIATAFAVTIRQAFDKVFYPKCREVDEAWRRHIALTAETFQIGRTHLQDGLPITVGAWLTPLHERFVDTVRATKEASRAVLGKFSGATGTHNAIKAMFPRFALEEAALTLLNLPRAKRATQVPLPEGTARFYFETTLVSAALANLGEDVRHLQSSAIGEVTSASSTSSTMSHKDSNPVAAENMAGMHVSVRAEFQKVLDTMNSDLQRDLRYSNVMRGYPAVTVFTYQQLLTTQRLFKSFGVNENRCRENFWRNGKLVVAELLHLSLQTNGYRNAHELVNKKIIPSARETGRTLDAEMDNYVYSSDDMDLRRAWGEVPPHIRQILSCPQKYLGDAVSAARAEFENALSVLE